MEYILGCPPSPPGLSLGSGFPNLKPSFATSQLGQTQKNTAMYTPLKLTVMSPASNAAWKINYPRVN